MSVAMTIITTLIIIAVLILVHEWGHFITARKIGIPVHEFSLGFGYRLWSIRKNGVEYSIRLVPIGGFVRMAGEEPGDQDDPRGYNKRKPLEKMAVSFAGPLMNFVLAVLIFVLSYAVIGIPQATNEPVIGKVIAGKPADLAGIKNNDRILAVNGQAVNSWSGFTGILAKSTAGKPVDFLVKRQANTLHIKIIPEQSSSTGNPAIGVMNKLNYARQSVWNSINMGFKLTYESTTAILVYSAQLFTGGANMNDLAGPVGITRLVGEAAQVGSIFLLGLAATLSINLGILNLLPIPALDGSRIVFAAVEAIRRKPLEPEKEGFIHWVGFILLIVLMVYVTFNDIIKLVKG